WLRAVLTTIRQSQPSSALSPRYVSSSRTARTNASCTMSGAASRSPETAAATRQSDGSARLSRLTPAGPPFFSDNRAMELTARIEAHIRRHDLIEPGGEVTCLVS